MTGEGFFGCHLYNFCGWKVWPHMRKLFHGVMLYCTRALVSLYTLTAYLTYTATLLVHSRFQLSEKKFRDKLTPIN